MSLASSSLTNIHEYRYLCHAFQESSQKVKQCGGKGLARMKVVASSEIFIHQVQSYESDFHLRVNDPIILLPHHRRSRLQPRSVVQKLLIPSSRTTAHT